MGLLVSVAGLAAALVAVLATRDCASIGRIVPRPDWVIAGTLGVVAIAGLGVASAQTGTVVTLATSFAGQLVAGAVLDRIW